jgi:outer membrane biosynthesis protein TonB
MPQYRNTTVSVELTIDRNGNVHNVVPVGEMSKELANRLIPAVQQWTFTPARNAKGETVQKTVILPITLS